MAKGEIFIPADCDDSFIPETLDFFNEALNREENIDKISGINVCCYDPRNNEMVGTPYSKDGLLSDNIELYYRYNVRGEHWGCLRVDLLKKYKFPDIDGHYYNESYLWFSFPRDGYKLRCYNKMLREYHYQAQSLTHNKSYKLHLPTCYMQLHFTWWTLTNVGHIIRKYSWKGYCNLYKALAKYTVKYGLAKAGKIIK